jgi:hypothetical protein
MILLECRALHKRKLDGERCKIQSRILVMKKQKQKGVLQRKINLI